jgi:hypothetical protein
MKSAVILTSISTIRVQLDILAFLLSESKLVESGTEAWRGRCRFQNPEFRVGCRTFSKLQTFQVERNFME